MILVDTDLEKILPNIITPYENKLVNSQSYDLRLSDQFLVSRITEFIPESQFTFDPRSGDNHFGWISQNKSRIILQPGDFILASTVEYFKLPSTICLDIKGKSTIGRSGLQVELAGHVDSGFEGNITLEIKNHLKTQYVLYHNQLIAQARFFVCSEPYQSYGERDSKYQKQKGPTAPNFDNIYAYC